LPGEGESEDLSSSGLFVRTRTLYPVGDETDLRLSLPDGSIVALFARVVHVLTARAARAVGRHPGMGLELIGPDTPGRGKLRAHVDSLRTEVTSPGWTKATTVVLVEPSQPLRARIAPLVEVAGPLQYSTHAAASSTVAPRPSTLTVSDGSAPTFRANRMNSSVPKSFGSSSFFHDRLTQSGRSSRGPIPQRQ